MRAVGTASPVSLRLVSDWPGSPAHSPFPTCLGLPSQRARPALVPAVTTVSSWALLTFSRHFLEVEDRPPGREEEEEEEDRPVLHSGSHRQLPGEHLTASIK